MPSMSLPPINDSMGDDKNMSSSDGDSSTTSKTGQDKAVAIPTEQPLKNQDNSSVSASISSPHIADDVDLIEKEWVSKIQDIIHSTRDDPYERARQLSLLKNEYLQKRYQKSIKAS